MAAILYDVFQTVVVPRWTARTLRLSPFVIETLWSVWYRAAGRIRTPQRREDSLGTFAPFTLMLLLLTWALALIFGYGLMVHALRAQFRPADLDLGDAFYLAGCSVVTLGSSDFAAVGNLARCVLLAAGASGLAIVALVISLAFTLYGQFQRREVMVLTLDGRAGAPPSGVSLLETYATCALLDDLPATFMAWELWSAEMLESHIAYPILPYFRSSHKNESWISAMGAVLDAATLLLTTIDMDSDPATRVPSVRRPKGAAELMYRLGCHALLDLSNWFRFRLPPLPEEPGEAELARAAGVERDEFVAARERLAATGYHLHELEASWRSFAKHRAVYAPALNTLARRFGTPPTQWIGDRSTPTDPYHREAAAASSPSGERP